MAWLILLLAGIAAIIAILASKPERGRLCFIAVSLMLVVTAWNGISGYREYQAQKVLQEYVYSQIESATRSLLGLVSQIVVQATDKWLPTNNDEFFSVQTSKLICNRLNTDARAPIVPHRSWLNWISEQTRKTEKELDLVLSYHSSALDADLIRSIVEVKKSWLIWIPRQMVNVRNWDQRQGYQRPPLLCPGLEHRMEESLSDLRSLYDQLWRITESKRFPMPIKGHNLKNRIGKARFSDEDLAKWIRDHPFAPSRRPLDSE